ncbi:hypothetical protein A5893_09615 [Pedobacter psychrophilus]|uniref:ATPase AAA-type core domain-containing protein n=2 Tax=Pedobacter psychrophilus TaxID=1826909 RepID=A0A179DGA8_9SPHI|nr:hypothetical protein A5893_09615 [Pedobacter psychrophilus]
MSSHEVFANRDSLYLNEHTLYLAYYNVIPNVICEPNINCKKAQDWLLNNFQNQIKDNYYKKRFLQKFKAVDFDDVFYFIDEDLMVNFDHINDVVRFLFRKTEMFKVNEIKNGITKFKTRKSKNQPIVSLLVSTSKGIDTKPFEINKPKLNISDNYNDDFIEVHQTILKRLNKKNDKGLVLLHGKPGTGKTSYIRYLISSVKKDVIFLPPNMASAITNPDLISVLVDNPNSIFVIEDAENIVVDRENDGNSPVSAILNISDGLLADCLNIQIICSFNTDISKVDNALMRKGRLIAKYEFKELEIVKAQKLSTKLGFSLNINSPMLLTSIYNQDEKEYNNKKNFKSVGFKISA